MKYNFNPCLIIFSGVIIYLIGSEGLVEAAIRSNCPEKDFKQLESILEKLVSFGKNQRKFPVNNEEVKKFCGQIRKDIVRSERLFKTCFDGTAKNFMNVLLYSFKSSMKTYCSSKNNRKNDFMLFGECINKPAAGRIISQELTKYIDTMQRAKYLKPPRNGIGYACCEYFKLMNELEKGLQNICNEKNIQIVLEFVRNLMQSLIDMGCGDYSEGSDTCSKLAVLPEKIKNEKRYGTFILSLVDFWNYLD